MGNPLDDIDWSRVSKRLTAFAHWRLGSRGTWQDAEDLANEAITRVFSPDYKAWDPATEPDLLRHLGSVVNGLISNMSRTAREELGGDVLGEEGTAPRRDAHRTAGVASWVDGKIYATEILERIATEVEGDKLASKVFWLEVEGVPEPKNQAARLGRPIRDIYNARRRLEAKLAMVKEALQKEARDAEEG